jgi:hypothetical protein
MKCVKDGCKAPSLKGDTFCYWHSEKTAKQRKQSSRKGGKRCIFPIAEIPDAITSIEDVKQILTTTIKALMRSPSENLTAKARAIGYLCSIMMLSFEKSDFENRLSEIEKLLSEQEILT